MENEQYKLAVMDALVDRVIQNVARHFVCAESSEERWENFRQLFLEGPVDHRPPKEPGEEDGYEDRYDQFFAVADALRAELSQRKGLDESRVRILIDPLDMGDEGKIYVAYLYMPNRSDLERGLLLSASAVSYGPRFKTLPQFAEYLWQEYARLEKGYRDAMHILEHVGPISRQ